MSKKALILVDIQNDYFEDGAWPVHKMERAAENAARLLEDARANGDTIVHIRHEIPSDEAPFFRPGSEGAQHHSSVAPQPGEPVILKHKANSFQDTSLKQDLDAAGVTDVVICGAMSQMCIDATTRAASDFGYAVTVVEDACGAKEASFGGVTLDAGQVHAAFMAPLAMSYAKVVTTGDFLGD
ncbi:cysteine hydrolase family protein [Hoeflea poritis]|uniref:Cysteine hydrolase family protein n=1 Tax=Hoeflea poritis TaxID=2993659 RepID=A0ABT4VRL6_9HYPH|nr:cysteine hydrolase family protein [Hoeflea poritis]MDA4847351.1 cysteine hydrolase family protein [Hoeflea poritis]